MLCIMLVYFMLDLHHDVADLHRLPIAKSKSERFYLIAAIPW